MSPLKPTFVATLKRVLNYSLIMATKERWLITGGAGYIGSHIADLFLANGTEIVIYDSLSQGLKSRVDYLSKKHNVDVPLVIADICDTESFEETIEIFLPQGIIHTAALKAVAESIENPDKYFDVNFEATLRMLEAAKSKFVKNFIFSSTAAVYGSPTKSSQVKESDFLLPSSPYGLSKVRAEEKVNEFLDSKNHKGTSLRFFNVVGTASPALSDNSVDNLLPIVINKLKSGEQPVVFGSDYPTQDGTCIRDFVDVRDVAEAHLMAALNLNSLPLALNVGTGRGRSVNEVIDLARRAIGSTEIDSKKEARRLGDVAELTADVTLIQSVLGFRAKYCLEESIVSMI